MWVRREGYVLETVDYKNRDFTLEIFVALDPAHGPGWYIWGRCSTDVIKVIARPDVPRRHHKHYNNKVQRGWLLKREATTLAEQLAIEFNAAPTPTTGE